MSLQQALNNEGIVTVHNEVCLSAVTVIIVYVCVCVNRNQLLYHRNQWIYKMLTITTCVYLSLRMFVSRVCACMCVNECVFVCMHSFTCNIYTCACVLSDSCLIA